MAVPGDPGVTGGEGAVAGAGGVTPSPPGPNAPWSRGQEGAAPTASVSRSVAR